MVRRSDPSRTPAHGASARRRRGVGVVVGLLVVATGVAIVLWPGGQSPAPPPEGVSVGAEPDQLPVGWSGTGSDAVAPVGGPFSAVSVGGAHACALRLDATAVC